MLLQKMPLLTKSKYGPSSPARDPEPKVSDKIAKLGAG